MHKRSRVFKNFSCKGLEHLGGVRGFGGIRRGLCSGEVGFYHLIMNIVPDPAFRRGFKAFLCPTPEKKPGFGPPEKNRG